MADLLPEIGLPTPEVVIHVNDRDPGSFGAFFEPGDPPCSWKGVFQKLPTFREVEIIDDIDEQ